MSMLGQMRILRFIIARSGSYHKQYTRTMAATPGHEKVEELVQVTQNGNNINPYSLNLESGSILHLNAAQGAETMIENGWETPRNVFMLDVEGTSLVGTADRYIFTGYTSHDAFATMSDDLDPNVELFFNNVLTLKAYTDHSGKRVYRIDNANQLLRQVTFNPMNYQNPTERVVDVHGLSLVEAPNGQREMLIPTHLRPTDVLSHLHESMVRDIDIGSEDDEEEASTKDGSMFLSPASRATNRTAIMSNYSNNVPNSYLARSLTALREVNNTMDYDGGDYGNHLEAAGRHNAIREQSLDGNAVLNKLLVDMDSQRRASLSFRRFSGAFPEVNHPSIKQVVRDQGVSNLEYYGYWTGRDSNTIAAATICAIVPALMLNCGMVVAGFHVSNSTYDSFSGQHYHLDWMEDRGHYIQGFVSPDLPQMDLITKFTDLIKSQLMPILTKNNQIQVGASINISIYKDAIVSVSLDNEPAIQRAAPAFASGLWSHLIGTSSRSVDGIGNTLINISSAFQATSGRPSPAQVFGNQQAQGPRINWGEATDIQQPVRHAPAPAAAPASGPASRVKLF